MHTKWKNSSVGKLFLALGINLVILALTQIFATSYFALYDDVVMNDIAAGYYGEDFSQYLVFPNIIYGFILKFLYSLSHAVNFYGIVQFVLAFFCFWMVSYVFLERYSLRYGDGSFCIKWSPFFLFRIYIVAVYATGGYLLCNRRYCFFLWTKSQKDISTACRYFSDYGRILDT